MNTVDDGLPRRMWHQLEPLHAVLYFLGAVLESRLLPGTSTLGITAVPPPTPRP